MDTILIPRALIVRIKTETDPDTLGPFCGLLFGETILDDNETVLHEGVYLFSCLDMC